METEDRALYLRAAGLGAIAGMRSMAAPALLSYEAAHQDKNRAEHAPLALLGNDRIAATLCACALGEMVVDKLPNAPDRTVAPSLIFRALSGALVGADLFAARRKPAAAGAAIGAAGAVIATFAGLMLRKTAAKKSKLPDPVIGVIEDVLAIGGGLGLLME